MPRKNPGLNGLEADVAPQPTSDLERSSGRAVWDHDAVRAQPVVYGLKQGRKVRRNGRAC
jgi:hypothetical protein